MADDLIVFVFRVIFRCVLFCRVLESCLSIGPPESCLHDTNNTRDIKPKGSVMGCLGQGPVLLRSDHAELMVLLDPHPVVI